MGKFINWIKKHLITSLAIVIGVAALVITGVSFLVTYNNYVKYSENYEKNKQELLANTPQLPESVFKDNEYVVYDDANAEITSTKAKFANAYLLKASDAEVDLDEGEPELVSIGDTAWEAITGFKKGGSMTYKINTAGNGMSDIDVYLAIGEVKTVPIDNLIDFITIKVNGLSVNTVDFDVPSDGSFQQLVLKNTNLIQGENTIEFATSVSDGSNANNFIMPAIAAVTFFTDVALAS